MINKEKFKKLVDLAYELEKLGVDVFLDYSGHVYNVISHDIQVYSYYILRYSMEFNKPVADDLSPVLDMLNKVKNKREFIYYNIDECINSLTRLLDEKKESLSV